MMKVYELFSDESRWTQRASARDKDGEEVFADSLAAVQWCLVGGLLRCYNRIGADAQLELIEARLAEFCPWSITEFNDHPLTTFEQVYALVKELKI
jgi:hypothetical protein